MLSPALGYPTKTAAIEALLGQGLDAKAIAEQLGCRKINVQRLIWQANRRVTDRKLVLPRRTLAGLTRAAEARGLTVEELVIGLLDFVIEEDAFDALLGEPETFHG